MTSCKSRCAITHFADVEIEAQGVKAICCVPLQLSVWLIGCSKGSLDSPKEHSQPPTPTSQVPETQHGMR